MPDAAFVGERVRSFVAVSSWFWYCYPCAQPEDDSDEPQARQKKIDSKEAVTMATKRSTKAIKASKNRTKKIPSVKRLDSVRPLVLAPGRT